MRPAPDPRDDRPITVADVARRQSLLRRDATCESVDLVFQADRRRPSALVATATGCLLVNRSAFYQAMTGRLGFGRTIHYAQPVDRVVAPDHLCLDAALDLEHAALLAIDSPQLGLADDALVRFDDGWGTVSAARLYQHLQAMHRARALGLALRRHPRRLSDART